MSVASRRRSAPRSAGPIRDQGPSSNADRATRTASSTSAASPSATVARTFPVAGLIVSNVLPDLAGTRWFPMSRAGCNEASHWLICGLRACPGTAVDVMPAVMVGAPQIALSEGRDDNATDRRVAERGVGGLEVSQRDLPRDQVVKVEPALMVEVH